jgi:hypothetical protein
VEYIVESTDPTIVKAASSSVRGKISTGSDSIHFAVALMSQLSSAGVAAKVESMSAPVVKATVIVEVIVGLRARI